MRYRASIIEAYATIVSPVSLAMAKRLAASLALLSSPILATPRGLVLLPSRTEAARRIAWTASCLGDFGDESTVSSESSCEGSLCMIGCSAASATASTLSCGGSMLSRPVYGTRVCKRTSTECRICGSVYAWSLPTQGQAVVEPVAQQLLAPSASSVRLQALS